MGNRRGLCGPTRVRHPVLGQLLAGHPCGARATEYPRRGPAPSDPCPIPGAPPYGAPHVRPGRHAAVSGTAARTAAGCAAGSVTEARYGAVRGAAPAQSNRRRYLRSRSTVRRPRTMTTRRRPRKEPAMRQSGGRGVRSPSSWRCLLGVFALFVVFAQLRFQRPTRTAPSSPMSVDWRRATSSASPASRSARSNTSRSGPIPSRGRVRRRRLRGPHRGQHGPWSATTTSSAAGISELQEGAGGRKRLHPGDTIPLDRTSPALDLDALIGGFRPLFRALDPDQVNALSGQLIQALSGTGRDDRLVPRPDRRIDEHTGRPRRADRPGHRQPQHRARVARRSK